MIKKVSLFTVSPSSGSSSSPPHERGEDQQQGDPCRHDVRPWLAGVGGGTRSQLARPLLGLCLHVQLARQLVNGLGQLLTLLGDVRLDLGGGALVTHPRSPFTTAMSSLTPSIAWAGAAGVACWTSFFPIRPATAAPMNSTIPTSRAASQSGSAWARARTAVATTQHSPRKASRPATLKRPSPIPARLPFSDISAWASRSSERISSGTCWVRSCTRAPRGGSSE